MALQSGLALAQAARTKGIKVKSRPTGRGKKYIAYGKNGKQYTWYEQEDFFLEKNPYEFIMRNLFYRRYDLLISLTDNKSIRVIAEINEYPKDSANGTLWEVSPDRPWERNGIQLNFCTEDPLVVSLVNDQAWLPLWDYLQD